MRYEHNESAREQRITLFKSEEEEEEILKVRSGRVLAGTEIPRGDGLERELY